LWFFSTRIFSLSSFWETIYKSRTADYIKKFESIQKKYLLFALRHLYDPREYNRLPSYEERLKIINLQKLSVRREHASAIFIFNILHGGIKSQQLSNEIILNPNRQTRNSRYLSENNHLSLFSFNAPLDRGIRLFNLFISCYDKNNSMSIETYKRKLKCL
jgi:hypothetical protein